MAPNKGIFDTLLGRRRPQPNVWTPQSGTGPFQPASTLRPEQANLNQNRINQVPIGAGNVGSTFGTSVPDDVQMRFYKNISSTLNQMVVKAVARYGIWYEFTINVSDQDYIVYTIGANLNGSGTGKIVLKEFMVENGRRTQQKFLDFIEVSNWRYSIADYNVVLQAIARRYGILMINSRNGVAFDIDDTSNPNDKMSNVSGTSATTNPRSPKTAINISQKTIKTNLLESMAKLLNNNIVKNEFTINATDQDYLRYTVTIAKTDKKSGKVAVAEEVIRNGTRKQVLRTVLTIDVKDGKFKDSDMLRAVTYINGKYQALISTVRYNTVV